MPKSIHGISKVEFFFDKESGEFDNVVVFFSDHRNPVTSCTFKSKSRARQALDEMCADVLEGVKTVFP